jgi:predicted transcriptional regulator of viral defense system
VPDPYLVAAALRPDAILSHHSALDLLGVAHSVFSMFAYLTRTTRRPLRFMGNQWHALSHPDVLVRAGRTDFGVISTDRRGVALRLTGAERTLVDGFLGLRWVGGLEEHVASAAAFRDLDLNLVLKYLRLLDRRILYAAVGWFLERHPETSDVPGRFLRNLEGKLPATPLYLGPRTRGGRLQTRWRLIVPAHLSLQADFEGSAP